MELGDFPIGTAGKGGVTFDVMPRGARGATLLWEQLSPQHRAAQRRAAPHRTAADDDTFMITERLFFRAELDYL